MALEIECKYLDADFAALRLRLKELGAKRLGRWFEANEVFDDERRSLKAAGTLLRLREKPSGCVLTLKRASSKTSAMAKIYEEHETGVADGSALREILLGLGYSPALRYEKLREKWTHHGCEICLDTLPFGDFVEIEGAEADIAACAQALGLLQSQTCTATYHELNSRHRTALGLAPDESFVFADGAKAGLLAPDTD